MCVRVQKWINLILEETGKEIMGRDNGREKGRDKGREQEKERQTHAHNYKYKNRHTYAGGLTRVASKTGSLEYIPFPRQPFSPDRETYV
jgi:hypothetical protein